MSETPRWDETESDARFAALYRAAARDEPSAALDAAVLAAARREVGAGPRPVPSGFIRTWRVPLSIAAVILLSVSLVTVMREEAPEVAQPPRADTPLLQTEPRKDMAAVDRMGASGLSAPPLAKQALPEAFPGGADRHKNKVAAPAEKPRRSTEREMRRDAPVVAETSQPGAEQPGRPAESAANAAAPRVAPPEAPSQMAGAPAEAEAQLRPEAARADSAVREPARARVQAVPAPMTGTLPQTADEMLAYANLPPERWLEQIDVLRKQGKLGEAKASLAEFKQRYPDYPLPASLKDGIKP